MKYNLKFIKKDNLLDLNLDVNKIIDELEAPIIEEKMGTPIIIEDENKEDL